MSCSLIAVPANPCLKTLLEFIFSLCFNAENMLQITTAARTERILSEPGATGWAAFHVQVSR
jgi:hypothetical protein